MNTIWIMFSEIEFGFRVHKLKSVRFTIGSHYYLWGKYVRTRFVLGTCFVFRNYVVLFTLFWVTCCSHRLFLVFIMFRAQLTTWQFWSTSDIERFQHWQHRWYPWHWKMVKFNFVNQNLIVKIFCPTQNCILRWI